MTPLISVCIPAYNAARYIGETLASVLDQDVDGLEVVVSDNASTDGTAEVVEAGADGRVRLVRQPRNLGAAANWNAVLAEGRGRWLKLLCADDVLYPHALRNQVDAIAAAPATTVMAASRRDIVDEHGRVLLKDRGLGGLRGAVAGTDAIRAVVRSGTNPMGEPLCVLLEAEAARRAGPFRDDRPYVIDLDFWCRVLAAGDLWAEPTTVGAFRVNPSSWSRSLALKQGAQVTSLLRAVGRRHPDVVRPGDVVLGTGRAWSLSAGRLAAYGATAVARRWRRPASGGGLGRSEAADARLAADRQPD